MPEQEIHELIGVVGGHLFCDGLEALLLLKDLAQALNDEKTVRGNVEEGLGEIFEKKQRVGGPAWSRGGEPGGVGMMMPAK